MTATRTAVTAAVIAVTAVTASACSVMDTATVITTFAPAAVEWGDCECPFASTLPGVAAVDRLECASVSVPADGHAAGGPTIDIAISRLPASSERSRGTLVVNPGGPGLEGRSMPATIGDIDGLSDWDIVGVDVRGTGASTRPKCTALEDLAPPEQNQVDQQMPQDALASAAASYIDMIAAANHACADTDGHLLTTLTPATAAADLDQVRTALDLPTISYFGASWGTALGMAYRTLFPEHLDTMILDSTVYLGTSAAEQNRDLAAAIAAERAAEPIVATGTPDPLGGDVTGDPDQPGNTDSDAEPDTEIPALPTDLLHILTYTTRTAYICNALDSLPPADVQWSEHIAATRDTGPDLTLRLPTPANSELPGASLCSEWPTPGQVPPVADTGKPLLLVGHCVR